VALNYSLREWNDVVIIDLTGHLGVGEAIPFARGSSAVLSDLVRELTQKSKRKIILNLADVSYVDSSGVGQLVRGLTTARTHGADLKLLNPISPVFGLLRVTKLDTVFDVKDDEAAAIAAFGP